MHSFMLEADVRGLVSVSLFDASCNRISHLPPEIGLMSALQHLKLHRNELVTLPPELGACGE
jgi:Leucine-rich repeat (LRR) protein